ncbi:MAG: hypothetical protein ABSC60_08350 [Acidobacteriota bacterium]
MIRFQAIGDMVLTIPACNALRKMIPDAKIELLTSDACVKIPRAIRLFDRIQRPSGKGGARDDKYFLSMESQIQKMRFPQRSNRILATKSWPQGLATSKATMSDLPNGITLF